LITTGRLRAIDFGSGKRRHFRIDPIELQAIRAPDTRQIRPPPIHRRPRFASFPSVAAYLPDA
jgi:hypothetical protein